MNDNPASFRSPNLMSPGNSALVVIDFQQKLVPHVDVHQIIEWNICRLIDGANALGVQVRATEQYPKGLGATIESIADRLADVAGDIPEKIMFSCRECADLFSELSKSGIHNLLLCGIETHVCVAQTALDLLAQGFNVYVCVDAVGARNQIDHDTALRRLESCGVIPTTVEAALFEWCECAGSDQFKQVSKLVQQQRP